VGNFLHGHAAQLAAAALALGVERDFVQQMVRQRRLQAPNPDAADWPWPLRVHALGGFAVWCDGQARDFGARPQKKPLDLLRLLVARGPAPLDTASVQDALWPEAEGDRAKASLDMAVLRLRKLLGLDDALRLDNGHLGLNRQWVWVDSWAWAAGQPLTYAGPLFGHAPPELPWAAQRESLHLQFLRRCHDEGDRLERAGRVDEALALYEAALAQDALDEALHRGAIRCHLALGEVAAAQRAFARCKSQLQAGLGIAPAPATQALLALR
jgi:DNA-binding SARP family transcriptional activator